MLFRRSPRPRYPIKTPITIVVAATLVVTTTMSDGLHWLPGMGHVVRTDGRILLKGVTLPAETDSAEREMTFRSRGTGSTPDWPEHDCPVCRNAGHQAAGPHASLLAHVAPLLHTAPFNPPGLLPTGEFCSFEARAPPMV